MSKILQGIWLGAGCVAQWGEGQWLDEAGAGEGPLRGHDAWWSNPRQPEEKGQRRLADEHSCCSSV